MRRLRFTVLITAAVALGAASAFALWSGLNASGVSTAARDFKVQVARHADGLPTDPSATRRAPVSWPGGSAGEGGHVGKPARVVKRSATPVKTGSVVVRFVDNDASTRAFVSAYGGRVIQSSRGRLVVSLRTPTGSTPEEFQATLAKRSDVLYATADEIGRLQPAAYTPPTDPYMAAVHSVEYHWWLDAVKAQAAWQTGFGSATTPLRGSAGAFKVAVIDTGIYMAHPDMANAQVGKDEFQSYSMNTDTYTTDNDIAPFDSGDPDGAPWHGTAVSGAIGAAVNGLGTVGAGYDVVPVGYKIEGPLLLDGEIVDWGMSIEAAAAAVYDATDAGCKVINMSFVSTGTPDPALLDAENYAHAHGVLMFAAAGNDATNEPYFPASDPNVVSVSAVATANAAATSYTLASFSNYGPTIDLSAPGQTMWLPAEIDAEGAWMRRVDGTSFAAPTAAGAAAFLWRAAPALTVDQLTSLLQSSAKDLGAPGKDNLFGYGMIDMNAAYNSLVAQYPPLAKPASLSVPAFTSSHSVTATWSPVAGTSVLYAVSLDGSAVATTSATSYTVTGVTSGAHTIKVQPSSAYNWFGPSAAISASTTVDSTAPVVSGFSLGSQTLSWSVAESSAYTVQAYIDAETPAAVAGNALTFGVLSAGTHTLHVNATDAAGNSSGWVTWQFAVGVIEPSVPSIVVTDTLAATVTWPAVQGATAYEFTVDGGSVLSTGGPGFVLEDLVAGVVNLRVRSVLATETSEWATATVTNVAVVPATPQVSVPATVNVPSATASWPAAADAKRYEYRLNGGSTTATSVTSVAIAELPLGPSTIEVRSLNNLSHSDWATAIVDYVGPTASAVTLSASTAKVTFPATTLYLTGATNAPGSHVIVQSSPDGHTWSPTGTSWTSAVPPIPVTKLQSIKRTTYYRLALTGAPGWTDTSSSVVRVPYYVSLKTPSAPPSVRHGKRFTLAEAVSAPARVSARTVTFKIYRWQKSGSTKKWVFRKSVGATGSSISGSRTTCRAGTTLSTTGSYRVSASFSGAGAYAPATTAFYKFSVK